MTATAATMPIAQSVRPTEARSDAAGVPVLARGLVKSRGGRQQRTYGAEELDAALMDFAPDELDKLVGDGSLSGLYPPERERELCDDFHRQRIEAPAATSLRPGPRTAAEARRNKEERETRRREEEDTRLLGTRTPEADALRKTMAHLGAHRGELAAHERKLEALRSERAGLLADGGGVRKAKLDTLATAIGRAEADVATRKDVVAELEHREADQRERARCAGLERVTDARVDAVRERAALIVSLSEFATDAVERLRRQELALNVNGAELRQLCSEASAFGGDVQLPSELAPAGPVVAIRTAIAALHALNGGA